MDKAIKFFVGLLVLIVLLSFTFKQLNGSPEDYKTDTDFNIKTVKSAVDFNKNGIDDYTDIMLGARKDAENKPRYDDKYISGGYPPENIGVCTDVVWRAFKNAGYSLKDMVDADIKKRPSAYTTIDTPDSNIDFRRVRNLHIYFEKYALSLTKDINDVAEWQPGDIVIFGDDRHIGIVSNKRNQEGIPFIIHNDGQPEREEDYLKQREVTAHYRFDASRINKNLLKAWKK